jgi:hypothetical protein
MTKPKVDSFGQRELDRAEEKFEQFQENIKEVGKEVLNTAPETAEPQTKISLKEIKEAKDLYVEPKRRQICKEPFNEKFRAQYEKAKEYVRFIAENNEIVGESIQLWTRPFPGVPAEEWEVPVNKPVWGPRYLAEQIARKFYHRLVMEDTPTQESNGIRYYGTMVIKNTIHRLNAHPASSFGKAVGF